MYKRILETSKSKYSKDIIRLANEIAKEENMKYILSFYLHGIVAIIKK